MSCPPTGPDRVAILLVGTGYDEFTLREAGFRKPDAPRPELDEEERETGRLLQHLETDNVFMAADSPREALDLLARHRFDLVICDIAAGRESTAPLSERIRALSPGTSLCLLTSSPAYAGPPHTWPAAGAFDTVLTWHGDQQLLRSIVLLKRDTAEARAPAPDELRPRAILLVEDQPRFAGLFLPLIHAEIFDRMRAILPRDADGAACRTILAERPRLLWATTFEKAQEITLRCGENLLGVISDIQFPRGGRPDQDAGFELAAFIRKLRPTLPVALQSEDEELCTMARALDVHCMLKEPTKLLSHLKAFMNDYLGFGPFILRTPGGSEVGRARDIRELAGAIERCPLECYLYHASFNHFSAWLLIHGHRPLALALAPLKTRTEEDRRRVAAIIREYVAALPG